MPSHFHSFRFSFDQTTHDILKKTNHQLLKCYWIYISILKLFFLMKEKERKRKSKSEWMSGCGYAFIRYVFLLQKFLWKLRVVDRITQSHCITKDVKMLTSQIEINKFNNILNHSLSLWEWLCEWMSEWASVNKYVKIKIIDKRILDSPLRSEFFLHCFGYTEVIVGSLWKFFLVPLSHTNKRMIFPLVHLHQSVTEIVKINNEFCLS
jgi:hypothetical protein